MRHSSGTANDTERSLWVTHLSTNFGAGCLTSVIERVLVYSTTKLVKSTIFKIAEPTICKLHPNLADLVKFLKKCICKGSVYNYKMFDYVVVSLLVTQLDHHPLITGIK